MTKHELATYQPTASVKYARLSCSTITGRPATGKSIKALDMALKHLQGGSKAIVLWADGECVGITTLERMKLRHDIDLTEGEYKGRFHILERRVDDNLTSILPHIAELLDDSCFAEKEVLLVLDGFHRNVGLSHTKTLDELGHFASDHLVSVIVTINTNNSVAVSD